VGDFVGAIGRGVGGLVGGSIDSLSDAFDTIVGVFQDALPGPLFPITIVSIAVLFFWWLLKK
jgi:hypothetical protein